MEQPRSRRGLRSRLTRAFLVQGALIALAAVLGVLAAKWAIEEVLIEKALEEEAAHYWALARARPDVPPPDTRNLTGYVAPAGDESRLPADVRGLGPGIHHIASRAHFSVAYVTEQDGKRLYLLFDGERVGQLALLFGLAPLGFVLAVLYLGAWVAWRVTQRAVSPVEWLAREVSALDPESPQSDAFAPEKLPGNPDREVVELAEALERLTRRINEFVARERNFTRDASHELRSPLTVIRLAADMLLSEQELDRPARNSVLRIKRSVQDMEELTDAFLLLARESDLGLSVDPVCVNDVVAEEVERVRILAGDKPIAIESTAECRLVADASDKVLSVLVGNLLRNAVNYTDAGRVRVHVGRDRLVIEDSGAGMAPEEVERAFQPFFRGGERRRGGHGVGLTIVKRFADRFGWPLGIDSTPGVGTRVIVELRGARAEPLPAGPPVDP